MFDARTIDLFVDRFLRLLSSVVEAPSMPVRELDILSAQERATVVRVWNSTDHALPGVVGEDPTLDSLFSLQVARSPYSIALVFEDEHVTYGELDERANQLARHLVSLGWSGIACGPRHSAVHRPTGRNVCDCQGWRCICSDRPGSPDRSVCVCHRQRTARVHSHHQPRLDQCPGSNPGARRRLIDVSDRATEPLASDERLGDLTGRNTAYVIYTSGSTGRPKGVAVTHGAIANRLLWMQDEYSLEPSDTVLQKTPATFDVSVWEFFWPLQVGAKLVIAAPDGHRDPQYLSRLILREHITTLHFVPSMLAVFVDGAMPGTACRCGWCSVAAKHCRRPR
ncbi:hypothetical protein BJF84_27555 [Rhodococcus sp. CUA-806]|nr:hypothetical protein BJF84_27555 [Rhodococcus sp. CUA-806]